MVFDRILRLSLGFTGAGIAALCGCNLPALMEAIKFHPIVLYGLKFFMSYALGYHYFCGLRHIVFHKYSYFIYSTLIIILISLLGSSFKAVPSVLFGV